MEVNFLVVLYVANMTKLFSIIIHFEFFQRTTVIISDFLNLSKVFFLKTDLSNGNCRKK